MVGIAGYKSYYNKKRPKCKGHIRRMCNISNEIVKNIRTDLFSNATIVAVPDISTSVWIKLHWLSAFVGRIGVMETIFPHCQQSFQHKCSAINEVMLTLSRFPLRVPPSPRLCRSGTCVRCCRIFLPGRARKKPREHAAPGAVDDAVFGCPAHWPMSWQ